MKIRLKAEVVNAKGTFAPGAEVDWPEPTARPLVDTGSAELVTPKRRAVKVEAKEASDG